MCTVTHLRRGRNLGLLVECALLAGGEELATTQIELNPSGRVALFIDQLFPAVDTSVFTGSLLCRTKSGSFSAIAFELGRNPGEFTTLPVAAPIDSVVPDN